MKKGDWVETIDDDLSGRVVEIEGSEVLIRTSDGFDMRFPENELVVVDKDQDDLDFTEIDEEVLQSKLNKKPGPTKRVKPKERNIPPMEVDLHIHQLVKYSKNMSNHEMLTLQLDTARRQLEFAIKKRIQKVVFIHGVGEGVLKMELEYLFGRYSNVKFYDADYKKYGLGATEVYIFQNS